MRGVTKLDENYKQGELALFVVLNKQKFKFFQTLGPGLSVETSQ